MKKLNLVTAALAGMMAAAPAMAELVIPSLTYRSGPYAANGIPTADGFADYMTLLNERDGGIGGELAMMICYRIVSSVFGVTPARIQFRHAARSAPERYAAAFGRVPEFGAAYNGMVFDADDARAPNRSEVPPLDTLEVRVRRYRQERGAQGGASALTELAREFDMRTESIVTIDEVVDALRSPIGHELEPLTPELLERIAAYRAEYGAV